MRRAHPDWIAPLLVEGIQPSRSRGWHGGPTPTSALRGVDVNQARWTPGPRRKSIWALALHIAYWKYAVRRLLDGTPAGQFARHPSNWPSPSSEGPKAWAADVALLRSEHLALVRAAAGVPPELLDERPRGSTAWTYGQLLIGIAAHDAYHTGQIQLMKQLWLERR